MRWPRWCARATEPALAAIKLAWWREQLEKLDTEAPPAEPRLQAARAELLPRGIKGEELAALEMGWAALLDESPDARLVEELGRGLVRGRRPAARAATPSMIGRRAASAR